MSVAMKILITIATAILISLPLAASHGMLWEPTNRGSLWRKGVPGAKTLYTDNQQVAGGPGVARANWPEHKYGICGDPYSASRPRRQETGGEYGKGLIASCYETGADVTFEVIITAHHKGSFDFGICKLVGDAREEESCFTPLVQSNGAERWALPDTGAAIYQMTYKLPKDLSCFGNDHCIIRWHYLTGNSVSPSQAEEFWSCADVKIAPSTSSCAADLAPRASPDRWSLPISNRATRTEPWVESPQWHKADNADQNLVVATPSTTQPPSTSSSQVNTVATTTPTSQSTSGTRPASCGSCGNCQWNHAGGSSCYSGWTEIHCLNAGSKFQWCGDAVPRIQPLITEAPTTAVQEAESSSVPTTEAATTAMQEAESSTVQPTAAVPTTASSPLCRCSTGGGCSNEGQCGNCLLKLGRNRACYADWNQKQCATAGPMYTWCGGDQVSIPAYTSAPSTVATTTPDVGDDLLPSSEKGTASSSGAAKYSGTTYVPIKNIDTYHAGPSPLKKAIVYAGAWTLLDSGRKFFLDQMDSSKMTHIFYSFYKPSDVASGCEAVSADDWTDTNGYVKLQDGTRIQGVFAAALAWRKKPENAHIKFVLSIGGFNHSGNFPTCTTDANRKNLVDSLVKVVRQYQLDGLDIDWEYPNNAVDWNNFRKLLGEVRASMDVYSPNKHLELSSAIGIGTQHRDAVPDWVCENLDSLNLMYYDVYGIWTGHTEHHAPFNYDPASPINGKERLTLVSTLSDLKKNPSCGHGAKLSLGLALYGRSWKVQTGVQRSNGMFATSSPSTGTIAAGSGALSGASYGANILTVGDILTNYLKPNSGFTRYWNAHWKAPYIYNPTTGVWAGYDDEDSMMIKVKYAEEQGLGSVFFWQASDDKDAGLIPKVFDYITRAQNP